LTIGKGLRVKPAMTGLLSRQSCPQTKPYLFVLLINKGNKIHSVKTPKKSLYRQRRTEVGKISQTQRNKQKNFHF
jgi:hypothetical protein